MTAVFNSQIPSTCQFISLSSTNYHSKNITEKSSKDELTEIQNILGIEVRQINFFGRQYLGGTH